MVTVPHEHPEEQLRLSEAALCVAFARPVHTAAGQPCTLCLVGPGTQALPFLLECSFTREYT